MSKQIQITNQTHPIFFLLVDFVMYGRLDRLSQCCQAASSEVKLETTFVGRVAKDPFCLCFNSVLYIHWEIDRPPCLLDKTGPQGYIRPEYMHGLAGKKATEPC